MLQSAIGSVDESHKAKYQANDCLHLSDTGLHVSDTGQSGLHLSDTGLHLCRNDARHN